MADATTNVAADDAGDPQVTFKVKTSGDRNHTITMAESATVLDLKEKLAGEDFENIPAEHQRLIYSGRVMKNTDLLSVYKIKTGNTVHLVKSAASNRASAAAGNAATTGAQAAPAVPTNMAAGTSAGNLLEGLTGARFAGLAPLPSADIFGPDGGMAPPPSEEQLADLLSQPGMAAGLNEALSNPAMIDYMIQSNPMLRNVPNAREMLQSPEFRQMMTDPESIRMAARMRRMMGISAPGENPAFPAPGATDHTTESARTPNQAAAAATATESGIPMFHPEMFSPAFRARMQGENGGANPFAALFGLQAQGNDNPATNPTGAGGPGANPFGMNPEILRQIMGLASGPGAGGLDAMYGLGGAGAGAGNPPDTRPPEERYADQLRQLNDMGFFDFDSNIAALRRAGGSVQGAIEHLLNNP